ncbi:hypothetical protein ACFXAZ_06445 [Streptomyces sp. NPDC059477]|uniref:hypothetical protein n=1 Tax=Streptomyces sp. NPDC059477 TaxID=3346847 RepID=UPI00368C1E2A
MVTILMKTRGVLCTAVAGSLALAVTGCAGGDDGSEVEQEPTVSAERLCGGTAVSPAAAEALEVIMGVDQFEASAKEYTIPLAVEALRLKGKTEGTGTEDICRIYTPIDALTEPLRVRWWLSDSTATKDDDVASKFTALPMGNLAGTSTDEAFVAFDCHDNNSPLTSVPYHIDIFVETTDLPVEPEGDPQALEDAFATLAHTFAVAISKELRCTDNGGLKAQPSLTPA